MKKFKKILKESEVVVRYATIFTTVFVVFYSLIGNVWGYSPYGFITIVNPVLISLMYVGVVLVVLTIILNVILNWVK